MRSLTEFEPVRSEERLEPEATWHKAEQMVIEPETSAGNALVEALRNCVDHLTANEACILTRAHIEGAHQMRVAVRRLRSRLSIYEGLLPRETRAPLETRLKWLIGRLGPARDWDVFLTEVLNRATGRYPDDVNIGVLKSAAERRCDLGYERAQTALGDEQYAELKALLSAWIDDAPWCAPADGGERAAELDHPARALADAVLASRHHDVLNHSARFDRLSEDERHEVRIEVKKLRYATEFFGSLYDGKAVRAYLASLKGLQDSLGASNDVVVARGLMWKLIDRAKKRDRVRIAFAAGLVLACQPDARDKAGGLSELWNRFRETEAFWD